MGQNPIQIVSGCFLNSQDFFQKSSKRYRKIFHAKQIITSFVKALDSWFRAGPATIQAQAFIFASSLLTATYSLFHWYRCTF